VSGQGLAAAELHFLRGQQNGIAAELPHGDFERDAGCASTGRSKIIASVLPASKPVGVRGGSAFMMPRVIDDPAQVGGRNVDEVEEVADAAHPAALLLLPPGIGLVQLRRRRDRGG